MFGRNKGNKGATLIAANAVVRGDLSFNDELIINGRVEGNVLAEDGSSATVTISAKGSVEGEIRVPNVVINGTVKGDVHSSGHVELAAKARVSGNVHYKLIEMIIGATVDGKLLHSEEASGGNARRKDGQAAASGQARQGAAVTTAPAFGEGTPAEGQRQPLAARLDSQSSGG